MTQGADRVFRIVKWLVGAGRRSKEAPLRATPVGENVPSRPVEGAVDIVWWESFRGRSVVLACRKTGGPKPGPRDGGTRGPERGAAPGRSRRGLPHIEG